MSSLDHPKIMLYGASGHARVVIDILEKSATGIAGLYDDRPLSEELDGYPILDRIDPDAEWIITVGNNRTRQKIALANDLRYTSAIHPMAILADRVTIGDGTVVMAGAVVNPGTTIGNHVILNTCCSVDHDCHLGDFVHISPGATLCGNVTVGEGTHIGAGATIIPGIRIGRWCTIGAGAVVIRDVEDGLTIVGNPGRVL